ncbi:MAG: VWA domain-containing protein [Methylococcaceae bacterium]|nr:VWA domain-containing protein [Methylococcaceae bacterium]
MSIQPGLALEGLYLYLVRNGFPLSVRDFRDALTALRQGYGLHRRDELGWLCETLWARNEAERLRLRRLFRAFPWPEPETLRQFAGEGFDKESPSVPTGEDGPGGGPGPVAEGEAGPVPAVEFAGPRESGLALPRAVWGSTARESFVFTPRPPVSLRSLIVAWRRYRRTLRAGSKVELDIDATVAQQCRSGLLTEPVLLPARRNQARLLVLLDVSPSMAPWGSLAELLTESLRESRLAHGAVYCFDNVPEDPLYADTGLNDPVPLADALQAHPGYPLLILSDGGAAKGRSNRSRLAATRAFLQQGPLRAEWQPVVWLNPMPRERWTGTGAARIAGWSEVSMLELSDDGVVQAVDTLRGKRSA